MWTGAGDVISASALGDGAWKATIPKTTLADRPGHPRIHQIRAPRE